MGVALEQIDDREIGGRLAVGHRSALQDQPVLGAVGVHHLVHQARLAHAGLPDARHDLAVPGACPRERLMQRLDLCVAPDKAGEAARRRGLQAPADGHWPEEFEHLDRLRQALDGNGSQGVDPRQTHQPQGWAPPA